MDWTFLARQLEGTIVNGMNDVSYPKKKKKRMLQINVTMKTSILVGEYEIDI